MIRFSRTAALCALALCASCAPAVPPLHSPLHTDAYCGSKEARNTGIASVVSSTDDEIASDAPSDEDVRRAVRSGDGVIAHWNDQLLAIPRVAAKLGESDGYVRMLAAAIPPRPGRRDGAAHLSLRTRSRPRALDRDVGVRRAERVRRRKARHLMRDRSARSFARASVRIRPRARRLRRERRVDRSEQRRVPRRYHARSADDGRSTDGRPVRGVDRRLHLVPASPTARFRPYDFTSVRCQAPATLSGDVRSADSRLGASARSDARDLRRHVARRSVFGRGDAVDRSARRIRAGSDHVDDRQHRVSAAECRVLQPAACRGRRRT